MCSFNLYTQMNTKEADSKLLKEYLINLHVFSFLLFTDIGQTQILEVTRFSLFPKFIITD